MADRDVGYPSDLPPKALACVHLLHPSRTMTTITTIRPEPHQQPDQFRHHRLIGPIDRLALSPATSVSLGAPTPQTAGTVASSASTTASTPTPASFDEVYHDRFEPMVRLACAYVDRRAVAEEIVQDSFGQLWQRWESVSRPGSYLRMAVVNGCRNELRRRQVRRDSAHKLSAEDDAPEGDYLIDALAGIPESRRKALVLRYYGGRTMNEIAEAMDIPTGTAKSLIHRGLADLRGALN